jgi:diacylglycerol kinase family enzyme
MQVFHMSYLEELGAPEDVASEEEYKEKIKKLSPFDFINSVSYTKQDIMNDDNENQYGAFIVNRGLGFGADTVIAANEMNSRTHLDNRMQYDFLRHVIRKAKRYNKWIKSDEDNIEAVKEYFGYSFNKAKEALKLLSDEDLAEIKVWLATSKGGNL